MIRTLALLIGLALAFAPLIGTHAWLPSAEAQFQAWTQAKTLQNAVTATANGASLDTGGNPIVSLQTSGISAGGQITPEGSLDGTTWAALTCYPLGSITGTALIIATASQAIVRCNVVGVPLVRSRISATGGTITVKGFATQSYFPLGSNAP